MTDITLPRGGKVINDYQDWIFDRIVTLKFEHLLKIVENFILQKSDQDLFLENSEFYNGPIRELQLKSNGRDELEIIGVYEDTSRHSAIVAKIDLVQLTNTESRLRFQEDIRPSNKQNFQRELAQFILDNLE